MDGESALELDPEVRETLLILAPQRFDVPTISVTELVGSLRRGPLSSSAEPELQVSDAGAVETRWCERCLSRPQSLLQPRV